MSLPTSPDDFQHDTDTVTARGEDYTPDPHMTPAEAHALLTATRRNGIKRFVPILERALGFVRDHWLAVINTTLGVLIAGALVTPLAFAAGLTGPASGVFDAYRFFCAQTPSHSFFIGGYQTCLCSRCLAIYTSLLLAGVAIAYLRNNRKLRALPWYVWLLGMVPMALDGFTQLFGLRESNLALRLLTGAIFGITTAWFLLPQIEEAANQEQPAPNPAAYAAYYAPGEE
ncbi:MAG TPA: DUF2085 domain-containing protein [Ktedonobacterales bacterium]